MKGCYLPQVTPGSGLCFSRQRVCFSSYLGTNEMAHDQAAKGCLFASIALGSVCMRVCACGICGEKSLGISHGLTGSEKQRTCAYRTRNKSLSAASHSYNPPALFLCHMYSRWILEYLCVHKASCLLSRWRNAQLKTWGLATELMGLLSG